MALNHRDNLAIQSLVASNVGKTFFGLRRFIKRNVWIGKNNEYSTDTVKKIVAEVTAGNIQKSKHLSQYIAASCLLHCADGWSYLGRSLLALLRGDPHRSRHFAYYAELRAAMSLLATQGVGVFDKKHVVIDSPNSVVPLTGRYGTHQFAWDCLECWSTQRASGDLFAKVIRPNGLSLNDWFSPLGGGITVAPQAESWFQQWGMDLKAGLDDRNSRNESSYRPDGLPKAWYVEGKDIVEFVYGLWSALEPTPDSRFDTIDKHILRIALERFFKGNTGSAPVNSPEKYQQLVRKLVDPLNFSSDVTKWWYEFLTRKTFENDPNLFFLSSLSPKTQNTSYASIISRATLLLRVASGATADLLFTAGLPASSTMFWWQRLGVARGLWNGSKSPGELVDLWADIKTLLIDLESFQQKHPAVDQTFLRLASELGPTVVGLGSCERVAIWSMTPSI